MLGSCWVFVLLLIPLVLLQPISFYEPSIYDQTLSEEDPDLNEIAREAVAKLCRELFANHGDLSIRMRQRPKTAYSAWFGLNKTVSAHKEENEDGVKYFLDLEVSNPLFNTNLTYKFQEAGKKNMLSLYASWRKEIGDNTSEAELDMSRRGLYLIAFFMSMSSSSVLKLIQDDVLSYGNKVFFVLLHKNKKNGYTELWSTEMRRLSNYIPVDQSSMLKVDWKELQLAVDEGIFGDEDIENEEEEKLRKSIWERAEKKTRKNKENQDVNVNEKKKELWDEERDKEKRLNEGSRVTPSPSCAREGFRRGEQKMSPLHDEL